MKKMQTYGASTVTVPFGVFIDLQASRELMEVAKYNKSRGIETGYAVEVQLDTIISHYFFGTCASDKKAAFEQTLLRTNYLSFNSKRKLAEYIVKTENLLGEGMPFADFEKLLRDVMSFRNACAHGELSAAEGKVTLSWFEGERKSQEWTDEYLTGIEGKLNQAVNVTAFITDRLRATTSPPAL